MSTPDFFRARLDGMLDPRHPLFVLAQHMPWEAIEATMRELIGRRQRSARKSERFDLAGTTMQAAGTSNVGRPRLPIRLMAGLLYLKHAYGESDESVVSKWQENPYWQYFCGSEYFETRLPCDASSLTRFRDAIGEAGVEELLAQTINTAVQIGAIRPDEMKRVIVDTTVQEKAVAFPTDSRLIDKAREKLVSAARKHGIALKQTYEKEGRRLRGRAARYAHAKQYRRMHRSLRRARTVLGRLIRDVQRKSAHLSGTARDAMQACIARAERIHAQRPKDKNKLYALHAPEVECISKGKARTRYEFGVKVGLVTTERHNLIVGARAFPGNPYDGHTLTESLEQATILMQDVSDKAGHATRPDTAIVDLGYRGAQVTGVKVIHRGRIGSLNERERRWLKRRQAIEPVIGHLKDDCGLRRNWLKGAIGDAINPVLAAAGYNVRWLMRAIARMGLRGLFALLALCRSVAALLRSGLIPTQTRPAH